MGIAADYFWATQGARKVEERTRLTKAQRTEKYLDVLADGVKLSAQEIANLTDIPYTTVRNELYALTRERWCKRQRTWDPENKVYQNLYYL